MKPVRTLLGAALLVASTAASSMAAQHVVYLDGFPNLEGVRAPSNEIVARLKAAHEAAFEKVQNDFVGFGFAETEMTHLWGSNAVVVDVDPTMVPSLVELPGVASVEEVYTVPLADYTIDENQEAPEGDITWSIERVKAPQVWSEMGLDGEGVVVGHIDTGVDPTHPDLAGKTVGWKDFIGDSATPVDGQGHGTHTAGTILGGAEGGTAIGMAPKAKMVVARVFGNGGASTAVLLESMQWMLDPDGDPSTADAPPLCSNSWGSNSRTDKSFWNIVQAWRAAGVLPVFAAGNAGPRAKTVGIPGGYPHSFGVGATDRNDKIASFSSRGPNNWDGSEFIKPDVSAPGKAVYSAKDGGGYWSISGTSMACPNVAGAATLIIQAHPGIALEAIEEALEVTARDKGPAGKDNDFGEGIIDVYAALQTLSSTKILGTVYGSDGQGLSARVTVDGKEIVTGDDGAFQVRVSSGSYHLTASAWAHETGNAHVTVDDEDVTVELHLQAAPAGTVSGTISGPEGEAVPASLTFAGTPLAPVQAGADGSYSVELPQGTYSVRVTAQGYKSLTADVTVAGSTTLDFSLEEAQGVLLVDDDGGASIEEYYLPILAQRAEGYEVAGEASITGATDISGYATVLWVTGDKTTGIKSSQIQALQAYLNQGGRVLLTGQNAAQALQSTSFLKNALGTSLYDGDLAAEGVYPSGNSIGSLPTASVSTGDNGHGHTTYHDALKANGAGAFTFMRFKTLWGWVKRYAGVARRGSGNASIVLGFGLEGIDGAAKRKQALHTMLDWLQADSVEEAGRKARFLELLQQ